MTFRHKTEDEAAAVYASAQHAPSAKCSTVMSWWQANCCSSGFLCKPGDRSSQSQWFSPFAEPLDAVAPLLWRFALNSGVSRKMLVILFGRFLRIPKSAKSAMGCCNFEPYEIYSTSWLQHPSARQQCQFSFWTPCLSIVRHRGSPVCSFLAQWNCTSNISLLTNGVNDSLRESVNKITALKINHHMDIYGATV